MRPVVQWMTKSDDAILELLDEIEIAIPPKAISFALENVSKPTVDRRLPKLESAGLIKRYEKPRGYRQITEKGCEYLRGQLTTEEIGDIVD